MYQQIEFTGYNKYEEKPQQSDITFIQCIYEIQYNTIIQCIYENIFYELNLRILQKQ